VKPIPDLKTSQSTLVEGIPGISKRLDRGAKTVRLSFALACVSTDKIVAVYTGVSSRGHGLLRSRRISMAAHIDIPIFLRLTLLHQNIDAHHTV